MGAAPAAVDVERGQLLDKYEKAHAIELVLNRLVDDPDAIFEPAELFGAFDSAFDMTRATELSLQLWPTDFSSDKDEEPEERVAIEARASLLAGQIFARLAENVDLLEEHATRCADVAAGQPLRLVQPR